MRARVPMARLLPVLALGAVTLLVALPAAATGLGVTLGSSDADDVVASPKQALGEVGMKGGHVQLVAVVTGEPGTLATLDVPVPGCLQMPGYVARSFVEVEPPALGVTPLLGADGVRVQGLVIPADGRLEVRVGPFTIAGANMQPCCLRASVTDADGRSVASTPEGVAGQACGGNASGFFVLEPAADAPAAN